MVVSTAILMSIYAEYSIASEELFRQRISDPCLILYITPARTHSISGLKYRVLKLTFLALKMTAKSGLEFILKFTEPLQRYLLAC